MNALRADQQIGQSLNVFRLPADDQHLQACVVIEVGMCGCDHQVMVFVLQVGQLVRQESRVVIVDKCDAADHEGTRIFDDCTDEAITYQVPQSFRTIAVTTLLDEAVEAGQEVRIDSNSRPC